MSDIEVIVVCAWPDQVWQQRVRLPEGSSVASALAQVPWRASTGIADEIPKLGIFGRLAGLDDTVCAGDRIELYRPLQIDPKQVRRERAEQSR